MTPTLKQCEELIDRIANKELSFGQRLVHKNELVTFLGCIDDVITVYRQGTGYDTFRIPPNGLVGCLEGHDITVLGHPIMIGDVLGGISGRITRRPTKKELKQSICLPRYLVHYQAAKTLSLWQPCGLNKSLQQILEEKPDGYLELFEYLISIL